LSRLFFGLGFSRAFDPVRNAGRCNRRAFEVDDPKKDSATNDANNRAKAGAEETFHRLGPPGDLLGLGGTRFLVADDDDGGDSGAGDDGSGDSADDDLLLLGQGLAGLLFVLVHNITSIMATGVRMIILTSQDALLSE